MKGWGEAGHPNSRAGACPLVGEAVSPGLWLQDPGALACWYVGSGQCPGVALGSGTLKEACLMMGGAVVGTGESQHWCLRLVGGVGLGSPG